MSTAVWPPIAAAELASEQTQSQQRELDWLLVQLKETLQSLKAGLEECAALRAPSENGSTLVLTSVRSESLKGLVTRVGTRIVKGVRCCVAPQALILGVSRNHGPTSYPMLVLAFANPSLAAQILSVT